MSSDREETSAIEKPNKSIKLILTDTDGNEIEYEIKKHIPLGKLLEAYCSAKGKNMQSLYMSIGGVVVNGQQNSNDLNLDEGTKIEIVSRQEGG